MSKDSNKNSETCDLDRVTKFIVIGLAAGGYEGGFNNCCVSSAGDYPSFGIGGWEGLGSEGDQFLERMAAKDSSLSSLTSYTNKSYSELESSGAKSTIQSLLESDAGQKAQLSILAEDFPGRYWGVMQEYFPDFFSLEPRSQIYIGMWMNTGPACCAPFIAKRPHNDFETVYKTYKEEYGPAAVSSEYWDGYANRADGTYSYVKGLDLTKDPDPSMAVNSGGFSSNNAHGKSTFDKLISGMGFDCKYMGETVTITKLPKGKTYPCEPVYPDWITVGDTIPQWVMSTTVAKVNQKNAAALNSSSTESSEILTPEEASDIKSSMKNIKSEINSTEEASYEKWCASNGYDYSDKTEENQAKIKAAYAEALKADESKPESERMFMNGYYHGGDTVIKEKLTKIDEKKATLNELTTKLANSNKKEEELAKAKVEKEYGPSKNKETVKEKIPEKEVSTPANEESKETPKPNKTYTVNKNTAFEVFKKHSTKITGTFSDYIMLDKITPLSDTVEITVKCITSTSAIMETSLAVINYSDNSIAHKRGIIKDIPDNEIMSYISIT